MSVAKLSLTLRGYRAATCFGARLTSFDSLQMQLHVDETILKSRWTIQGVCLFIYFNRGLTLFFFFFLKYSCTCGQGPVSFCTSVCCIRQLFSMKKFINKNALQYQMDVTHYGQPWAAKDRDFILESVQNNSDLMLSEERAFWTCTYLRGFMSFSTRGSKIKFTSYFLINSGSCSQPSEPLK